MKKITIFFITAIMIICQASTCFAEVQTLKDDRHKFYGGSHPDFGSQVWSITTVLSAQYTGNMSSGRTINLIDTYATGERHAPQIGEGAYTFTNIKTYATSTLLGTDSKSSFSNYSMIIGTDTCCYFALKKNVNYFISQTKNAKLEGNFYFTASGWVPLNDWSNTLILQF